MGDVLLATTPRPPRRPGAMFSTAAVQMFRAHARSALSRMDRIRATTDAGFSLLELVVSMAIMSTIGAMFTTAAVQMFRSETDTETIAAAQSGVNLAFLRLDKDVRYAAGISVPLSSPTSSPTLWYVEYLRTDGGAATCTELKLDTTAGEFKSRSWLQTVAQPPLWQNTPPLMSNVITGQFVRPALASTSYFQTLQIVLTIAAEGRAGRTKTMATTFTAANTSLSTLSDTVCTEGRTAS